MIPSDVQGVGHFRNIWPAQAIEKYYKEEFDVDINPIPDFSDIEWLKQYDIVHFHRHLGPHENADIIFQNLKEANVKLVMDIDDYWTPSVNHPLYEIIKKEGLSKKITDILKRADYVTTTTDIFANQIRKFNPNVQVIENAVNIEDKMWQATEVPNEKDYCRIAWIGGSSHLHDLKLMENSFGMLYRNPELHDKFQVILCGFDTRGTITEIMPNGQHRPRPILPHETVWNKFEGIFTDNYRGLSDDPEYTNWLKQIKKGDYPDQANKRYIRRWTLPLTQYAKHYDYSDVCLAPLDEFEMVKSDKGVISRKTNIFNEVKSELKIIEAGMKKKVLIAQDFGIYKELIKDGETGLLVNNNDKGWYKAMRRVILDKDLRNELAENLHKYVIEKYDVKLVTAKRLDFYKSILNKDKNSKTSSQLQETK